MSTRYSHTLMHTDAVLCSGKIMDIFEDCVGAEQFERASIDEAFMDVSELAEAELAAYVKGSAGGCASTGDSEDDSDHEEGAGSQLLASILAAHKDWVVEGGDALDEGSLMDR